MSRVAATRVMPVPAEVAWGVFADLAGRGRWLSDVERIELLTLAGRPLQVGTTWRETRTDRAGRSVTEELAVVAIDPGRSCTIGLAGGTPMPRMTYVFAPIAVGPHRGGTAVQVIVETDSRQSAASQRSRRLADRLLAFVVGGFAAQTAEGALRTELESLAAATAGRSARESIAA